jgi:hypothetical protein
MITPAQTIRDIKCHLGFHEWESLGEMIPIYGHEIKELFVCRNCNKQKKVFTRFCEAYNG